MILVHADAVTPVPWRNGGGLARDLLVWPGAAWRLRISLADIAQDGPFSAYPGVARWFAVAVGAGVALALPGGERQLRPGDAPLAFDGVEAPACRLLEGPVQALNLMLQGGLRGELRRDPHWAEPWALHGRYDRAARTLHWGLPAGESGGAPALWIGVCA